MIEQLKAWGATGAGSVGWYASMNIATDVIQFVTAVLSLVSICLGLWLFFRQLRKP